MRKTNRLFIILAWWSCPFMQVLIVESGRDIIVEEIFVLVVGFRGRCIFMVLERFNKFDSWRYKNTRNNALKPSVKYIETNYLDSLPIKQMVLRSRASEVVTTSSRKPTPKAWDFMSGKPKAGHCSSFPTGNEKIVSRQPEVGFS